MQYKAVVLASLATAVSAQIPAFTDPAQQSALLALATALPPSILAQAATNQAGFASEIASSIAAGKTPAWYQALPTDVKSALASIYPISTPAASTPSETAAPSSSVKVTSVVETSVAVITSAPSVPVPVPSGTGASSIGTNSTGVSTVKTPSLSGTSAPQPTNSVTPGAASIPSAAIGAGIAGAMAFLSMLVL